jgi:3-oxoacyl-[acyl-carrier protein] reductase
MDLGLRNKIALVAASSQGLGKAVAESLSEEGATVVICARDKKNLAAAAKEISAKTGGEVLAIPCDVSKAKEIDKLVKTVVKKFGSIHVLVNNAGGPPVESFDRLTDEHWSKGVELTMMSAIRLMRAVIPFMQIQHWGRIITINSITGKQPIQELVISSTLRPGLIGLQKVLATQYANDGILINTVCPGFVMTKRQEEISKVRSAKAHITAEEYM